MTKKNKVKYSLRNVHYAPITISEEDGSASFAKPIPWPGAVSISISPDGEISVFYADGIAYFFSAPNSGYSGDFETALIPDEFETDCIGNEKDQKGMIFETNAPTAKPFALLFEFEGDVNAQRHCLYYCHAARSEVASETKTESVEPVTDKLSIKATPSPYVKDAKGRNLIKIRSGDNADEEKYNAWYESVPLPDEAAG